MSSAGCCWNSLVLATVCTLLYLLINKCKCLLKAVVFLNIFSPQKFTLTFLWNFGTIMQKQLSHSNA